MPRGTQGAQNQGRSEELFLQWPLRVRCVLLWLLQKMDPRTKGSGGGGRGASWACRPLSRSRPPSACSWRPGRRRHSHQPAPAKAYRTELLPPGAVEALLKRGRKRAIQHHCPTVARRAGWETRLAKTGGRREMGRSGLCFHLPYRRQPRPHLPSRPPSHGSPPPQQRKEKVLAAPRNPPLRTPISSMRNRQAPSVSAFSSSLQFENGELHHRCDVES